MYIKIREGSIMVMMVTIAAVIAMGGILFISQLWEMIWTL